MKLRFAMAALLSGFAPGCFIIQTDDDPVVSGFAQVDWTIDGSTDPDQCDLAAVDAIDLLITTSRGDFVRDVQEACEDFSTAIELPPNRYFLDAVLLDIDGFERTTVVRPPAFEIFGDDVLDIPIDFPADSFF